MEIISDPELSRLTTLRLGGRAVAMVRPACVAELEELPAILDRVGGRPTVLGRGSNVLAQDGVLPLTLVRPPEPGVPQRIGEGPAGTITVRVDAGLPLPRLLVWCREQGLSGLENLSGIPGEVGGAVAMNAGSYGGEIAAALLAISVFSPQTGIRVLKRNEVTPRYRELAIPTTAEEPWWLVTEVVFSLRPAAPETIAASMASILKRKCATQPVWARSAGCVFKNPEGASAGKLLDEAGFRGKKRGGMSFSSLHANFLINDGNGTASDALNLIAEARERVANCFGVALKLEVKVLSC